MDLNKNITEYTPEELRLIADTMELCNKVKDVIKEFYKNIEDSLINYFNYLIDNLDTFADVYEEIMEELNSENENTIPVIPKLEKNSNYIAQPILCRMGTHKDEKEYFPNYSCDESGVELPYKPKYIVNYSDDIRQYIISKGYEEELYNESELILFEVKSPNGNILNEFVILPKKENSNEN